MFLMRPTCLNKLFLFLILMLSQSSRTSKRVALHAHYEKYCNGHPGIVKPWCGETIREVFIRVNTIEIEKQASLEAEEWQLKDEED